MPRKHLDCKRTKRSLATAHIITVAIIWRARLAKDWLGKLLTYSKSPMNMQ